MEILLRHRRDVHRRRERLEARSSLAAIRSTTAGTRSSVRDNSRCASVWPIGISRIAADTVAASRVYANASTDSRRVTPADAHAAANASGRTGPMAPSLRHNRQPFQPRVRVQAPATSSAAADPWRDSIAGRSTTAAARSSSSSSCDHRRDVAVSNGAPACHTAGPSSRPIVSSSTASSHACRPAASAIVPSLVAALQARRNTQIRRSGRANHTGAAVQVQGSVQSWVRFSSEFALSADAATVAAGVNGIVARAYGILCCWSSSRRRARRDRPAPGP